MQHLSTQDAVPALESVKVRPSPSDLATVSPLIIQFFSCRSDSKLVSFGMCPLCKLTQFDHLLATQLATHLATHQSREVQILDET